MNHRNSFVGRYLSEAPARNNTALVSSTYR